jgi:hypothetical protein
MGRLEKLIATTNSSFVVGAHESDDIVSSELCTHLLSTHNRGKANLQKGRGVAASATFIIGRLSLPLPAGRGKTSA